MKANAGRQLDKVLKMLLLVVLSRILYFFGNNRTEGSKISEKHVLFLIHT